MTAKRLYKRISTASLFCINILILQAQTNIDFIEKVQQYQKSVRLMRGESGEVIDPKTFSINQYMNLFCNLQKDTDIVFNVKYYDTFSAGRPYIYTGNKKFDLDKYLYQEAVKSSSYSVYTGIALKEGARIKLPKLILNSERSEYMKLHNDTMIVDEEYYTRFTTDKLYKFLNDSTNRACTHIQPEESEEGYLQYLFFYLMGEQFALKWHALYNEKSIISSIEQIKQFVKEYRGNKMFETSNKELRKILKVNATTAIRFDSDNCIVTWYEIETHNGIYERTYKISRVAPYQVKQIKEKELVTIGMNFIY